MGDDGVVAHPHRPEAIQLFMGALVVGLAVGLEVLDKIDHLDVQPPARSVEGEQAGKEKLFIVGVGGDQHQVCLLQWGLPHLDPVGQPAGGKGVNFPDGRPRREVQGELGRRAP